MQDFETIADLLHDVVEVCKTVQKTSGKLLKDFVRCASCVQQLLHHGRAASAACTPAEASGTSLKCRAAQHRQQGHSSS